MSSLFNLPWQQAFDSSGNTLAGAKLYFYTAGTSTPQNVYSDINLGVALPNPVVANGAGRFPPIYMDDISYKVALYNDKDELVWTADNVWAQSIDADAAFATAAVKATTVSAGYTEDQAEDSSNFPKAVFKYANASTWYTETGSVENTYVLEGVDDYSRPIDYIEGMHVWFVSSRANTGASTVNVAGLGAKNIYKSSGSVLYAGDITGLVHLVFNGTSFLLVESDGSKHPIGSLYSTTVDTNPNVILGFGTWTKLTSSVVTELLEKTPIFGEDNTCLQVRSTLANGTSPVDYNLISSSYTHDGNIDGLVLGDNNLGRVNRAGKVNIIPKSDDAISNAYADTSTATTITVHVWERTA